MENGESLILELVSARRRDLFNKKKTRFATKKRQRKWEEIHLALVDNGFVSPLKHWNTTRTIWYRMVSSAKASLLKYVGGKQNKLHWQDRKVLDLLGIPIIPSTLNISERKNLVVEEGSHMRIEGIELFEEDNELTAKNVSEMSDLELKINILKQEFKLNEYKLLKMKFFFLREGNKQIYEQFLKQLEM